nr:hypothetical protein [Candidatus Sigynarchaeum springense]
MEQLNFRISKDEKRVIEAIAAERGVSTAELARRSLLKEIEPIRVDLAFKLLSEGKIGRKRAWTISGLSHNEFLIEWTRRGAEEQIPDEFIEKELDIARSIDLKKFMRNQADR